MRRGAALALALSFAGAAHAQEKDAPICTDRPARANAVCTVPAGRIQVETSALGWTVIQAGPDRAELLTVASSVAKIGLTDRSDLQIGFTPFAELTGRAEGASRRISGLGDILVRYKHRLTSADAPVQLAAIPFVKLPAATGALGNGRVEGGIALPVSFALGAAATLTLGPELDLLADADGSGRHLAMANLINLSLAIAPRWTLAGEIWTNFNFDPDKTISQASADAAIAYALSNNLQLDSGANVGLTRATPDLEFYVGLSVRF
ncbi:MAG TPA: transporter [Allosphingosinicella sp.]|nr:transporter [Allosphingosinicella sp.]